MGKGIAATCQKTKIFLSIKSLVLLTDNSQHSHSWNIQEVEHRSFALKDINSSAGQVWEQFFA